MDMVQPTGALIMTISPLFGAVYNASATTVAHASNKVHEQTANNTDYKGPVHLLEVVSPANIALYERLSGAGHEEIKLTTQTQRPFVGVDNRETNDWDAIANLFTKDRGGLSIRTRSEEFTEKQALGPAMLVALWSQPQQEEQSGLRMNTQPTFRFITDPEKIQAVAEMAERAGVELQKGVDYKA
jgi:hypothetical protein